MSNLPSSPSDAAEPRAPKINDNPRDDVGHVHDEAWLASALEILTAAQNAKDNQAALTRLACHVLVVATAIEEKSSLMTEEEQTSLRRTMDGILILTKNKADKNQFDVLLQIYKQELQHIKHSLEMDRLEKVTNRLEQLSVLQPRTEFVPNSSYPPSLSTPSSTPWSLTSRDSTIQSSPVLTRRDAVGSAVVPPSEPLFPAVSARPQEAQPVVYYNTYNNCVFGDNNTNCCGSQEGT